MREMQEPRWKTLCRLAIGEHDPDKLLALVHEINILLDQKERPEEIHPIIENEKKENQ